MDRRGGIGGWESATALCPPDTLTAALQAAQADPAGALDRIGALLRDHPGDPRLHFLQGSMLAGSKRYDEAQAAKAGGLSGSFGWAKGVAEGAKPTSGSWSRWTPPVTPGGPEFTRMKIGSLGVSKRSARPA